MVNTRGLNISMALIVASLVSAFIAVAFFDNVVATSVSVALMVVFFIMFSVFFVRTVSSGTMGGKHSLFISDYHPQDKHDLWAMLAVYEQEFRSQARRESKTIRSHFSGDPFNVLSRMGASVEFVPAESLSQRMGTLVTHRRRYPVLTLSESAPHVTNNWLAAQYLGQCIFSNTYQHSKPFTSCLGEFTGETEFLTTTNSREFFGRQFAMNFLMPEESLRSTVESHSVTIFHLSTTYRVPCDIMFSRVKDLGYDVENNVVTPRNEKSSCQ